MVVNKVKVTCCLKLQSRSRPISCHPPSHHHHKVTVGTWYCFGTAILEYIDAVSEKFETLWFALSHIIVLPSVSVSSALFRNLGGGDVYEIPNRKMVTFCNIHTQLSVLTRLIMWTKTKYIYHTAIEKLGSVAASVLCFVTMLCLYSCADHRYCIR